MPAKKTKAKDPKGKGKAPLDKPPPADKEEAKGRQNQVPEACQDYALFVLDLDNLARSYREVMGATQAELVKCLISESTLVINGKKTLRKVNGKLYTPKGGAFLIQMRPRMDSPSADWVTLLFRWSDLYFESFNSRETWFMTKGAQMPIPPRSQIPCSNVHVFRFDSSYDGIGGYNIRIGPLAFQKMYMSFLHARALIVQRQVKVLRSGPLSLGAVAFSEALRFPYLQIWVYKTLLGAMRYRLVVERSVPKLFTEHFNSWRKESDAIADSDAQRKQDIDRIRVLKSNHRKNHDHEASSYTRSPQVFNCQQRPPPPRTRQVKPAPPPVPAPSAPPMPPQPAQAQVPPTPPRPPVPVAPPGAVPPAQPQPSPPAPEAAATNGPQDTEAMQVDPPRASLSGAPPPLPPEETLIEEAIRLTRGRLRRRLAGGSGPPPN